MTLKEHVTTDMAVCEHLLLGEVVLEVIEIGAGVITVKSNRNYTFQKNKKIRLARGGYDLFGSVNKAFKFLTQCSVGSIDYVAVPVERASVIRVWKRFSFYNKNESLGAEPFYEGLVAKIGSEAGLNNFEEILSELDTD